MKKRIYLSSPHMSEEGYELEFVHEAFDTNWIAPAGPHIIKFEEEIAEKIEKPSNFDEMILLAENLSDKFPFVRVDFYSIQGKTIFGEMTFYPSDGRKDFHPNKYNEIIGDLFVLPEIPKGQKYITEIK